MKKKIISIVSPTYNEENNIQKFIEDVNHHISQINNFEFELIIIDNSSTDNTVAIIKKLISKYKYLKLIVNLKNYGHIISPYHGILQAKGSAVIYLASDLQDPPRLISKFIDEWQNGWKVVYGCKDSSDESIFMFKLRKLFYFFINLVSNVRIIPNATGFGLYDREVIQAIRTTNDKYPFMRGLVSELGYNVKTISFHQPVRAEGNSKNNFKTLYDIAILALIKHSNFLVRVIIFIGALLLLLSIGYLIYLILFLEIINFESIVLIFLSIITLFCGFLGEYLLEIKRQISNKPILIEKERVNFSD